MSAARVGGTMRLPGPGVLHRRLRPILGQQARPLLPGSHQHRPSPSAARIERGIRSVHREIWARRDMGRIGRETVAVASGSRLADPYPLRPSNPSPVPQQRGGGGGGGGGGGIAQVGRVRAPAGPARGGDRGPGVAAGGHRRPVPPAGGPRRRGAGVGGADQLPGGAAAARRRIKFIPEN